MEILRALGALVESPSAARDELAAELELGDPPPAAAHTELFSFQLLPYASIYLGSEGRLGGEAGDRMAGFWRALGLTPPPEPDHLATLLAAYAGWVEIARDAAGADARRRAAHCATAFLGEHLLSWLSPYLLAVRRVAAESFHRRWADLLWACLERECERLAPPSEPSQHQRASRPLEPTDLETPEGLSGAVLIPVRSGLILTRSDLAGAARTLSLASRIGERRFMLEAMLAQDPAAVHRWIGRHAEATLASYRSVEGPLGESLAAWRSRVLSTLEVLAAAGTS